MQKPFGVHLCLQGPNSGVEPKSPVGHPQPRLSFCARSIPGHFILQVRMAELWHCGCCYQTAVCPGTGAAGNVTLSSTHLAPGRPRPKS